METIQTSYGGKQFKRGRDICAAQYQHALSEKVYDVASSKHNSKIAWMLNSTSSGKLYNCRIQGLTCPQQAQNMRKL